MRTPDEGPEFYLGDITSLSHKVHRNLTLLVADRISVIPLRRVYQIPKPSKLRTGMFASRWSGCGSNIDLSTPWVPAGRFGLMDLIRRALG